MYTLYTSKNNPVHLDDVWEGTVHRCQRAAVNHSAQPVDYDLFRQIITGRDQAPVSGQAGKRVQGLVVDVLGSEVKLLTCTGVLRGIQLERPVTMYDFLQLDLGQQGLPATNVRRLALLSGSAQRRSLPGWSCSYAMVSRDV